MNSFPQSIWSGAQCFYEAGNQESKELAVAIQDELAARLGPNRRRPVAADYLLLKTARMPAVTVEVGFISNSREERMLADAAYRQQVADAIFAGTVAYLLRQRERAGSLPVTDGNLVLTGRRRRRESPAFILPPRRIRARYCKRRREDCRTGQDPLLTWPAAFWRSSLPAPGKEAFCSRWYRRMAGCGTSGLTGKQRSSIYRRSWSRRSREEPRSCWLFTVLSILSLSIWTWKQSPS